MYKIKNYNYFYNHKNVDNIKFFPTLIQLLTDLWYYLYGVLSKVFYVFNTPDTMYERSIMASSVKIKLKGYDHKLVDSSVENIVSQVENAGGKISGPIPLPTDKSVYTIIRAVHKYKSSREQFEIRTHKRLIQIDNMNKDIEDVLSRIAIPAGVMVEIKM